MTSDEIWSHIDAERIRIAELLRGLSPEELQQPSLCDAWTVRDVGAHLTMAHATMADVFWPFVKAGGDFNTMVRRTALENAMSVPEIADAIEGFVGSRKRAPMVSELEPLVDVVVHGEDIRVPLGISEPAPVPVQRLAADRLVELNRRPIIRFRRPLTGVRLQASDDDWARGSGPVVHGPLWALVLYLAGRDEAALPHLSGATDKL